MAIRPEDIERQVFKERFRGYDQEEVDGFLDRISASIAALQRERDELKALLDAARRDPAPQQVRAEAERPALEQMLRQTLDAAQRAADEAVAEARAEAARIVEQARREAAHEQAAAREQGEAVRRAVEDLRRFRDDYRERLHGLVSEQLAALDRAGELPRLPAAVEEVVDRVAEPPSSGEGGLSAILEHAHAAESRVTGQGDDEAAFLWDEPDQAWAAEAAGDDDTGPLDGGQGWASGRPDGLSAGER